MNIQGKTIILTGASRIGKDVAQILSENGANLVVSYNSSPVNADEIKNKAEVLGSKVITVKADVSKQTDVESLIEAAAREFGRIDGLVHMAASYNRDKWEDLSEEKFEQSMNVIAKSTFLLGKAAGDVMLKNDGDVKGKIITISDWSVLRAPFKDYVPYNAAKAAVISLTLSLAKELAPYITVNNIAPGPILKPPDLTDEENKEALVGTPLARWGGGEEIAKAVKFFFDSDFTTGVILPVDGGRSIA